MKTAILGTNNAIGLDNTYKKALLSCGCDVRLFAQEDYVKHPLAIGRVGQKVSRHLSWEKAIHGANIRLARDILDYRPELILVFTNFPLLAGSVGFFKSAIKSIVVNVWPDTIVNLRKEILAAAVLYDGIATHGRATIPILQKLGFASCLHLPFAGDTELHGRTTEPENYKYDISFVGGWRPEREEAVTALYDAFSNKKIAVFGPFWERSKNKNISSIVTPHGVTGAAYADTLNVSRVNLNLIDAVSYPSVNMRFYEIPTAYGLQVVNHSPEQADVFRDGEHLAYFENTKELVQKVRQLLDNPMMASAVRKRGHDAVESKHNYAMRAKVLIDYCKNLKNNG